ncbi:MAG: bifunctional 3'-5' exonuclease/DNA polymerase, partial [Geodermatophilaceae bacterium]|nr:bifunctional 3'-5' exonuclease/DNA polymerase [Geodermatophilaceae bacterium]
FTSAPDGFPAGVDPVTAHAGVYADQLRRIAGTGDPRRFALLVAAESAGALAAVEMSAAGLPWRNDAHARTLEDLLGPRTPVGVRPARLAELAAQINAAFGGRTVNPDSPAEVLAAFAAAGHDVESTRSWVLRDVAHPAVTPLLAYKKLARVHSANGWAWQERWVREGRFRPGFVPGGVVSGRWATRGGGGLQIPRQLKGAAVADPDHLLVVADAGQLEPRLLAALSGDPGMRAAADAEDLYAAIAVRSFRGDRARAKIGLLGAMYGQVGGQAAAPLAVLRDHYPAALRLLEDAAHTGERSGLVRSHLGRTCPPARDDLEPGTPAARARGRFTRNFVVQATAAEWALSWLALTRAGLVGIRGAALVFFVHDELVVHSPQGRAEEVAEVVRAAAARSGALLFGPGAVPVPLDVAAVRSYADAG